MVVGITCSVVSFIRLLFKSLFHPHQNISLYIWSLGMHCANFHTDVLISSFQSLSGIYNTQFSGIIIWKHSILHLTKNSQTYHTQISWKTCSDFIWCWICAAYSYECLIREKSHRVEWDFLPSKCAQDLAGRNLSCFKCPFTYVLYFCFVLTVRHHDGPDWAERRCTNLLMNGNNI